MTDRDWQVFSSFRIPLDSFPTPNGGAGRNCVVTWSGWQPGELEGLVADLTAGMAVNS
jgi:hypothetical protein